MLQPTRPVKRTLVLGMIAVGMAVAVSSLGVVRAEHFNPDKAKIFKCSNGKACLTGSSSGNTAWGVYGLGATTRRRPTATTNFDDWEFRRCGHCLRHLGQRQRRIRCILQRSGRIYGTSSKSGSSGVYGNFSGAGYGVFAVSSDTSGAYPALVGQGTSEHTYMFYAHNTSTDQFCTIDGSALMECTGGFVGSSFSIRQRSNSGRHMLAYVAESATPTSRRSWGGAASWRHRRRGAPLPICFRDEPWNGLLRLSHPDRPHAWSVCKHADTRGLPSP